MSAVGRTNRRGFFYDAPACGINLVPGVKVKAAYSTDIYVGTAEDLTASGLVPAGMFPGDPGMPLTIVSLRPVGGERVRTYGWHRTPGYLRVQRLVLGGFRVERTVSLEEQARRRAAHEAAERERDQSFEQARARRQQEIEGQAWGYASAVIEQAQRRARHG